MLFHSKKTKVLLMAIVLLLPCRLLHSQTLLAEIDRKSSSFELANMPLDYTQSVYHENRVFTIGTTTTNGTTNQMYVSSYEQGESNWEKLFPGFLGNSYGTALFVSASGSIYAAGAVLTSQQLNLYLVKMGANGDTLWTRNFDGNFHQNDIPLVLEMDSLQENIFVCGISNLSAFFPESTGDYWSIKLDTLGQEIFSKVYDNGFRDIPMMAIPEDSLLLVIGSSGSSSDSSQPFVMAYDINTGDSVASERITNYNYDLGRIKAIAHNPTGDGYVLLAEVPNGGSKDILVMKFDSLVGGNDTIWEPDWTALYGGDNDDTPTSLAFDDQGRIFVSANLGKGGGKKDGVVLTYTPTSDTSSNLSSVLPVNNPDPNRNTEIHRLAWRAQKLYAAGIQENASGENDVLILRQNNGLGLDYVKISPNQNLKEITSLKPVANDILYVTGIALTDTGQLYRSLKFEQIEYKLPPPMDSTETQGNFAFYQNRGQLVYADTAIVDSVAKEVKYYTHNTGLPTYIRSRGWSVVVSASDTSAATADTIQRVDFDFVTPKSGAGKVYALDSNAFYLNYYLGHCPQGVTGVHANTGLLDKKVYTNMDVFYSGNNKGMRMQAAFGAGINPSFELEVSGADTVIVLDSNWVEVHTFQGIQYYRVLAYQTNGTILDSLAILWEEGRLKFDVDGSYNTGLGVVWQWDGGQEIQTANPNHFNIGWCSYFGNDDDDELTDVIVDNQSNSYYCGSSSFSYFPLLEGVSLNDTIINFTDKCILNINIDNNIIPKWYTLIGVSENANFFALNSIQRDNLGNIYSGGETNAPDLPLFTPPSAYRDSLPEFFPPSKKGLLVKLDSAGYVVWTTAFKDYGISDIVLDDHDNLFVTSGGFEPLHRFSTTGEYIAPMDVPEIGSELGGHSPVLNALAFSDSVLYGVGYVLIGHVRDTAPPDTMEPNPELESQFYYIYHKLDNGSSISADYNNLGSPSKDDYLSDVAVDGEQRVYMVGNTRRGQIPLKRLDPNNPDEFMDSVVNEGVIFRLPQYLDSLEYSTYWGKGEGNNIPAKIAIDNDDNVYICGYTTSDSLPMPNGGNPANYYAEPVSDANFGGDMDGYFLKLSPNCELLWSTYFYTKNSNVNDRVLSIASDGGGRLYFAGWVGKEPSNSNFINLIPYQDYSISSLDYFQQYRSFEPQSNNEAFFGCFDSLKLENTAGVEQFGHPLKDQVLLYPNPATTMINVTNFDLGIIKIDIVNMYAQTVFTQKYDVKQSITVDIGSLTLGAYLISISDGKKIHIAKMIKQ